MISEPAARSHFCSPSSQKPSTRPAGDVAKIERGGAEPPDARRLDEHGAQHGEIGIRGIGRDPVRESGRE